VSLVTLTTNTSALLLHQLPPWSKAHFDVCAQSAPAQRSPPRCIVVVALRITRYSSKPVLSRGLSSCSGCNTLFKLDDCWAWPFSIVHHGDGLGVDSFDFDAQIIRSRPQVLAKRALRCVHLGSDWNMSATLCRVASSGACRFAT